MCNLQLEHPSVSAVTILHISHNTQHAHIHKYNTHPCNQNRTDRICINVYMIGRNLNDVCRGASEWHNPIKEMYFLCVRDEVSLRGNADCNWLLFFNTLEIMTGKCKSLYIYDENVMRKKKKKECCAAKVRLDSSSAVCNPTTTKGALLYKRNDICSCDRLK